VTIVLTLPDRLKTPLANSKFLQLMMNRVATGVAKHGGEKAGTTNWIPRLKAAVRDYEATGNWERLVDAANYAMYEATMPDNPASNFSAGDSQGFRKLDGF
jgi:hypothetical protein